MSYSRTKDSIQDEEEVNEDTPMREFRHRNSFEIEKER